MYHCNSSVVTTARLDTATALLEGSTAPGILTAKTLQSVLLSSRQRSRNDEVKPSEEIVSPYGRMQRQDRARRYNNRPNDSGHLHTYLRSNRDVARRKRCRKLDPMPALMLRSQTATEKPISNQISGGNSELEVPDKVHIEQLRLGLNQNKSKQQQDAERLQREIQWIHGHFPVLKLANAKCSRSLRQELFRTAIIHVLTNFTLRRALLTWYQKLLDFQRKERLQLSASRQLIAMFRKLSLERAANRFNAWRQWVSDSQAQENMAAAITLQRFSKFLKFRREEQESAEQQASLLQALDKVHRSAKTIQRAYLKYRQHLHYCRHEFAARQIQRIAMRRRDYNSFIKRRNAAAILQRSYRAYLNRRSRKRARTIAQLLDRSREQQARRIQTAWRGYKEWRDKVLVGIVHKLVDQVEVLAAVLAIQRHLRRFQCRFRIKKKKEDSAIRIQKCWQARRRREASRAERRMMLMQQNVAASYLQRTFRRHKVERKVRGVLRKSTRPLYLRARHFSESFREQFRLPIVKSATVVIQTTWRLHFAYEKKKQCRIAASETIRGYLKHGIVTSKWRTAAMNLRHRRDAAARTLQHWIRRLRSRSSHRRPSVGNILEQISATIKIQLWYRRRRYDLWRLLLDRLLVQELPRCIEAVNRIARCWKGYCARKQENLVRANVLADLIEQQRQSKSENCAARIIQRMIKRRLDKRNGQILLHQYRILLRQDMKRRQQRAIVHRYLEEKSQLRKKKQESQATTLAARQPIFINSMESSQTQGLSLDSYISEASAFSLDENPTNNEILTTDSSVQYWSDEYERAYLYDPVTGVSTWL